MQTDLSTLTRRLRIAFDVEVNIQPILDETVDETSPLMPFQQALLNNSALCDRLVALRAIDSLLEHVEKTFSGDEESDGLSYSYSNVELSAIGGLTMDQALPFLAMEMFDKNVKIVLGPMARLFRPELISRLPLITDLDTGEPLDWQDAPPMPFLFKAQHDEYWLVKIQGENVLVLNLLHFPSTWEVVTDLDTTAAELQRAGLETQRILALVGNNEVHLIPEASDAIQVCCAESFPGLPVEIKIIDFSRKGADEQHMTIS